MSVLEEAKLSQKNTLPLIKWDKQSIGEALSIREAEVLGSLDRGEKPRKLALQTVIIKSANSPFLLERFLTHMGENLANTSAEAPIRIGVVDDSSHAVQQYEYERVINEARRALKMDITYLRLGEQNSSTLIGRIRNEAIARMRHHGAPESEIRKMLLALQYLTTEEFKVRTPDKNPADTSDGYIAQNYSTLGNGSHANNNAASFLGAFIAGREGAPIDEFIVTHNDDDIIYRTLDARSGLPQFQNWDYLGEREVLYADPKTSFTAGKYVGVSGSPLRMVTTACEIALGIIENNRGHVPPNALSPYYLYDPTNGAFSHMTVSESLARLPEIIDGFLARTPITGFKISETFDQWLTARNVRFDEGNYTVSGSLERRAPSPVGGIMEFIQTGVLKSLHRGEDISRVLRLENEILHLRQTRPNGGDAFAGNALAGSMNSYTKDQILLHEIIRAGNSQLVQLAQEAYGDSGLNSQMLGELMPNISTIKMQSIDSIRCMKKTLECTLDQLKSNQGISNPLTIQLQRLLDTASDENLDRITATWGSRATDRSELSIAADKKDLNRVTKYTRRFLEASKYWQSLYDIAYDLGKTDAGLPSSMI